MKHGISVPDDIDARVERERRRHGMSRSAFYTRGAQQLLAQLDATSLPSRIDAALETAGADGASDWVAEAGRRFLAELPDEQW